MFKVAHITKCMFLELSLFASPANRRNYIVFIYLHHIFKTFDLRIFLDSEKKNA
uniref:Uncharacterized protein n=1 Tax=Octopus bimaculoides TaxID=37653 RepID=A0A0L8HUL8_OCTBM